MSELSRVLGSRIRTLRQQIGMSQEELAFKASLSAAHLGQIERALKNPTVDTVSHIADALGITVDQLFQFDLPKQERENVTANKILAQLADMTPGQQRDVLKLIKIFKHFREDD